MRIRILCCLALVLACKSSPTLTPDPNHPRGSASSPEYDEPIWLTLIGTNDLHGWVFPHESTLPSGTQVEQGGVATFAGYVANLRANNPGGTLLVDAGDLFQGTLAANLTEGAVAIEAYNRLGYQAAAIGNHEFDYGPVGPVSVAVQPDMDPFGAFKVRLREAKFPLLAANIYDARTGGRPDWLTNDGMVILDIKGVKIGILGLITPNTPTTTNPINVRTLRFGSLVPEAQRGADELRRRGAELVVLLIHEGGRCLRHDNPRDLSSCERDGDIFQLLQALPPKTFDAVVAGHIHHIIGHFINEMPVIETPGAGEYFGVIELFVDPKRRRVLSDRTLIKPLIPICAVVDRASGTCEAHKLKERSSLDLVPATFLGKDVIRDQLLERALQPARLKAAAEQNRKLGITAQEAITRNYLSESALGDFIADSIREMEKADIGLVNPGGLRADIPRGELTYGNVYEVLPFDNALASLTVTSEELTRLIRAAYNARKGVFQVSGLEVKLSQCPGQNRVKEITLRNGKPLAAGKFYRVVLPDFLAQGGDGLGGVISSFPKDRVDLGERRGATFRDELIQFWQRKNEILRAPKLGRLTFLKQATPCEAIAGQ
jgi:5'-nucleotidase